MWINAAREEIVEEVVEVTMEMQFLHEVWLHLGGFDSSLDLADLINNECTELMSERELLMARLFDTL